MQHTLTTQKRIESIDLLRGLVMIIMALDHTRDFFHQAAFTGDPLDLSTTTPMLYFTRWITHFCAPVFVFLSGTSIFLQGIRKTKRELGAFLFKRGLWLIFIELFIIGFAWTFDITFSVFVLQVIWAIGISMFLMGLFIRLPFNMILVLGIMIVFGHNAFDTIKSTQHGFMWDLLRNGNFATHSLGEGHHLIIIYPFVPWLGLMMLGYCLGKLFVPSFDANRRRKILTWAGFGILLFFVLLRFANVYGDPVPWASQKDSLFTFLSFINLHKYPPSLLYMCVTIGIALLFLVFFENTANRLTRIIIVYGRVPFFYYVAHFYLLHILCMILFVSRGHAFSETTPDVFGIPFHFLIAGEGYSLSIVYLIWILVVISLYPICKWYDNYKTNHKEKWWLSYL